MIRRPPGRLWIDPAEPKLGQIEFVGKDVDYPNRIVLADPVVQAFRKKRALLAISSFNEPLHPNPRSHHERIIPSGAFSHSQGHSLRSTVPETDPLSPDCYRIAAMRPSMSAVWSDCRAVPLAVWTARIKSRSGRDEAGLRTQP